MKAQVSLKTGKGTEAIAKALKEEAKAGLPKVDVKVWPAGEKLKIELEAGSDQSTSCAEFFPGLGILCSGSSNE